MMITNIESPETILCKFLITLLVMAGATRTLTQIKSHCGHLSVAGYLNCQITHNDELINYTGLAEKIFPGQRFGLITYSCDNVTGYLISDFDCKGCGSHCSQEEHEIERQQENVQFWAGVVLSLFLSCAAGGLIGIYYVKFLHARVFNAQRSSRKQPDNKKETAASTTRNDVTENNTDDKIAPGEDESCGASVADTDGRVKFKNFFPRVKRNLSSFITGLLFVQTVNACEWTFLVGQDNLTMVCHQNECQNSPPAAFSVAVGQKVCFEDLFGGAVSLIVNEITYRSRYELVYYTSDYIATDNMTAETCEYTTSGVCQSACHHTTLMELNEGAKENSTDIYQQGWTCDEIVNYYDYNYGRYQDFCCRYFWKVQRISDDYPVFTEVGQTWMANITISQNDSVRQLILDAYDPSFDLTGFKLNTTNRLPFIVTNAQVTNLRSASIKSLLLYNEKFYHIEASKAKKPQHDLFGDFQVPVAEKRVIFAPPQKNVCRGSVSDKQRYESKCSCNCNFPRSKISTFAKDSSLFAESNHFAIRNDHSIVDTFDKYGAGNVSFKLGEWKIEDSAVKNAKCDFEYVLSYSCPSCNESAYVVLIPRNVKREGVVPFYSNCSFDRRMLRCDLAEPMKLVLRERYDSCLIKMPTLSRNMLIDVELKNIKRKIYPVRRINTTAMTYGQTLSHLVTSEKFINSFTNTLIFCVIIFIVVILSLVTLKMHNNREKVDRETDLALI